MSESQEAEKEAIMDFIQESIHDFTVTTCLNHMRCNGFPEIQNSMVYRQLTRLVDEDELWISEEKRYTINGNKLKQTLYTKKKPVDRMVVKKVHIAYIVMEEDEGFSKEHVDEEMANFLKIAASFQTDPMELKVPGGVGKEEVLARISEWIDTIKLGDDTLLGLIWSAHGEEGRNIFVNDEKMDGMTIIQMLEKKNLPPRCLQGLRLQDCQVHRSIHQEQEDNHLSCHGWVEGPHAISVLGLHGKDDGEARDVQLDLQRAPAECGQGHEEQ